MKGWLGSCRSSLTKGHTFPKLAQSLGALGHKPEWDHARNLLRGACGGCQQAEDCQPPGWPFASIAVAAKKPRIILVGHDPSAESLAVYLGCWSTGILNRPWRVLLVPTLRIFLFDKHLSKHALSRLTVLLALSPLVLRFAF